MLSETSTGHSIRLISLCAVPRNLMFVYCILLREMTVKVNIFLKRIQSVYFVMVFEIHL